MELIGHCKFVSDSQETDGTIVQSFFDRTGFCKTPCVLFNRKLKDDQDRMATVYIKVDPRGRIRIVDCEAIDGEMV